MSKIQEDLKNLLKRKKSVAYYADKLGISIEEVKDHLKEIKEGIAEIIENTYRHNIEKGEIEVSSVYPKAPTPEQIIKDHNIDVTKWKLSSFWSKQTSKGYRVSALFSQIKQEEIQVNNFIEFLSNYNSSYNPLKKENLILNDIYCDPVMVEISLADYHFDKANIENETIEKRTEDYLQVLNKLIHKCYSSFYIDEITFVIANDFFNTDNWQGATTLHMNPQDINCSWDSAYEKGFDLLVTSIITLKQFCNNLNIIVVQGNHAKTKEFYLGHALEVYFRNESNIVFNRSSSPRKIYSYYNTSILYHHGNCKIDQLPLMMASEFPVEWGKTKYHECHTGDKHFYMEKEINGVRIKQMPSMSPTDRWHTENNYCLNIRAGLANVYSRDKGRVAEFEERI